MGDEAGAGTGTASSSVRAGAPEDYLGAFWRAIAVFRVAALAYAVLTVSQNFQDYRSPIGGWVVLGVMALWTAFTVLRFPPPPPPAPPRRADGCCSRWSQTSVSRPDACWRRTRWNRHRGW